jgi:hypothetical protein
MWALKEGLRGGRVGRGIVSLSAEAVEKVIPAIISFLLFGYIGPPQKLQLTDYNL